MSSAPTYRAFEEATEHGITHPDLLTLFTLWNAQRGDKEMPLPGALQPRDMKHFLSHIHLYDVIDGGKDFRTRVIGTRLAAALGFDATGKLVSNHPDLARRARFQKALSAVMTSRKPMHLRTDKTEVERGLRHEVQALWLPLGRDGVVEQIIGLSVLKSFQLKG
jgi:hypothetical protein